MTFDALIIPGGGVRDGGVLPEWSKRRCDKALELFSGTEYIISLSAGSTHKAFPLNDKGLPIYESVAATSYLEEKGVPKEKLLTETVSLDTIGNAYFLRVIHTDPRKLKKLCIITSDFHMPRTKAIFEWVFSLQPLHFEYELEFVTVSDEGLNEEIISARKEKEAESLKQFEETKKRINNFKEFHAWLFSEHAAYAIDLKPLKTTGKKLDSY